MSNAIIAVNAVMRGVREVPGVTLLILRDVVRVRIGGGMRLRIGDPSALHVQVRVCVCVCKHICV